ncbi:MAG: acyltransferase [Xanthomonadaceae bacterium]|jgi:predicted LPLAT superfamily acyltransferase|nr:acyltransferase [Xanthomonadaceae bacterium]
MSASPAPHWARIGETTSVTGIRVLLAVERWLGRWPFRLCLAPVVLCHWAFNGTARRASLDYLRRLQAAHRVFPNDPGVWTSLRHFARFAESLLDKLKASHGNYRLDQVEVAPELMQAPMARGGGVIIGAHLGCLELCQVMVRRVPGLRVTALVHTAHAEAFNRMLKRLNPDGRVELLQVTALDAAMAMCLGERVSRGEFIAITGDRVPVRSDRVTFARFLGAPAPFPVGPYVLAAALGCPLYAMACTREAGRYRMQLECLAERVVLPRGEREAALARMAACFSDWLEARLRAAPLDWFNFFPFWDQSSDEPARK